MTVPVVPVLPGHVLSDLVVLLGDVDGAHVHLDNPHPGGPVVEAALHLAHQRQHDPAQAGVAFFGRTADVAKDDGAGVLERARDDGRLEELDVHVRPVPSRFGRQVVARPERRHHDQPRALSRERAERLRERQVPADDDPDGAERRFDHGVRVCWQRRGPFARDRAVSCMAAAAVVVGRPHRVRPGRENSAFGDPEIRFGVAAQQFARVRDEWRDVEEHGMFDRSRRRPVTGRGRG